MAVDDIEDRAAALVARMAARRAQRETQAPLAVEERTPSPSSAEAPTQDAVEAVGPEEKGRHRAARRMAPPPWQPVPPPSGPRHEEPTKAESPRPHAESTVGMRHSPPLRWGSRFPPLPPGPDAGEWLPELPPPPPGWTGDQANRHLPETESGHPRRTLYFPAPLDEAEVLTREKDVPRSGWRRAVHGLSRRHVNPGPSRKERERRLLFDQIRRPIAGDFRIAVLSVKGGVGKTTTTLGLGSALAMVRTDRVIAVDANPDRGTLAERVLDASTSSTVRDLLRDSRIRRYADVRNHTRMSSSRLEVLASEQDPAVAEVFGEADYRRTIDILRHYYNVILTDCGTGIMHSAMAGVLDLAHAIVLVSAPAIDAARSAAATLDWLTQHGHATLVREAHVVFSASQPRSNTLKLDRVVEHFEARCGSIHVIPFERHLAEGADFDFGLLRPVTTQAYFELAEAVSQKFSRSANAPEVG